MQNTTATREATAAAVSGVPRNASIDHLRIVLTGLVIFHHVAIVYGGSGGWYWREQTNASSKLLLLFNAINQAYFMGFFFLLAGYYTPSSYDRKGPARFVGERLLRLGVPLLVYFFLLHPLTVAIARTHEGHPLWSGWAEMIRSRVFGPGPVWFAETLLVFAAGYWVWRQFRRSAPTRAVPFPSITAVALTALALGGANFLVRFVYPVGQEVLWLQLGYFPCYIFLFAAGCASSRSRMLESISFRDARPWLIISAVTLVTMPLMVGFRGDAGGFGGGLNLNALYYALWDPFTAAGIILGLLWAAQTYWSRPNPLTAFLSRNAYGAYIVHPPVVVAFSLLAVSWPLPPLAKFLVVGGLAGAVSFLIGGVLRLIPGTNRIL